MCASCGCGDPTHKHPGSDSITWQDIEAAARDAEISPEKAIENMAEATEQMDKEFADFLASLDEEQGAVLKAEDEKRFLLTVVYSPHRMPLRGKDGRTDLASADVLEKACWYYAAKAGLGTGMWHEDGHEHEAVCVENYIYRGPDWAMKDAAGNEVTVKAGDWLAGYLCSPRAWDLYKSGQIGGVSMQGAARRKPVSAEALARVRG